MNALRYFLCVLAVVFFALFLPAGPVSSTKAAEGVNPLKEEMFLLDRAYKNLVDSIVLDNPRTVEAPFMDFLEAKEATEKALEAGEIKLPKNGGDMRLFREMDEQFHAKVRRLVELSKRGDMRGVRDMAHKLLNGCVQCHARFRK